MTIRKYGELIDITTIVDMTPKSLYMNSCMLRGSFVSTVSISLVNLEYKEKNELRRNVQIGYV